MNPKKRTLGIKLSVCLLSIGSLLPSCTGSPSAPEFTETPSPLRLSLSLAMPQTVTVESRSVTASEVTVSDVRVFQFAENGSLKNNHKYTGSDKITQDDATGLSKVTTEKTDFDDITSRFYIVINTADALNALPATPSDATDEGRLLAYTHTESGITSAPQVMVYGPYNYTGTSSGNKTALQLLAKMQHIGARVDVSWTIPTGVNLTITSASVENIPDKYYLYTQPTTSLSYTASQDITPTEGSTGFTFYMPRNEKGIGTATTPQEKNIPAKGPSGSLTGCTCIVLKGTYKYNSADTDGIAVEYRFYPGADMMTNYSIERGKAYQLAITLSGANSADARVSLTDSNVFGIDNIDGADDVNHDIEF